MYTQVSIVLLGSLFFVVQIQGGRSPLHINDVSALASDKSVLNIIETINTKNALNLIQKLKRSRRQSSDEQQQFRDRILEAHNEYRARHCVSPLALDDELNNGAQQYAEHLVEIDSLQHSQANGFGENLYTYFSSNEISSDNNIGRESSDAWYNEVNQYDFNEPGFSFETGHFTQLVWKNSEKLGAGIAFNSDRTKVYVVARYSPAGNYEGQYEDNVHQADC